MSALNLSTVDAVGGYLDACKRLGQPVEALCVTPEAYRALLVELNAVSLHSRSPVRLSLFGVDVGPEIAA